MSRPAAEFSCFVTRASVPQQGRAIEARASEAECRALALRFGIPAIESLTASLQLLPLAGGRIRVTGRLEARVVQICVASLEPFAQAVEAPVAVTFVPRGLLEPDRDGAIDPDAEDEEPYDGDRFDIGEVLAQTLSLALDPWPRDPHASPPPTGGADQGETWPASNPFAALARRRR